MKSINDDNLNIFVGLCVDAHIPVALWMYCTKGSLRELLANESYKLDWTFKFSFIKDTTMVVFSSNHRRL